MRHLDSPEYVLRSTRVKIQASSTREPVTSDKLRLGLCQPRRAKALASARSARPCILTHDADDLRRAEVRNGGDERELREAMI